MAAPSKSAGNRMRCCRASCRYPLSRHSPDFDRRRPSIARQAYWTRLNRLACPHTATFAHGRTMVAGLRGSAGLAGYCRYVPGVREICIDRVSNLIRIPAWSLRLGALDSPVEGAGFEPSVPRGCARRVVCRFSCAPTFSVGGELSRGDIQRLVVSRGTEGSNPASFTGESVFRARFGA